MRSEIAKHYRQETGFSISMVRVEAVYTRRHLQVRSTRELEASCYCYGWRMQIGPMLITTTH